MTQTRKADSSLEPFLHRCPKCGELSTTMTDIVLRQIEKLLAERDRLKERVFLLEKGLK